MSPAAGRRAGSRGFTLLEVVIALLILSASLMALMQLQTNNIRNAGRARDLTIAVALARGKMVDIEQRLFHDGFPGGVQAVEGDFAAEGQPTIRFKSRVSEVQMDLSQLAESYGGKVAALGGDRAAGEGDFAGMMQMAAQVVGPFVDSIAASVRVVELEVLWQDGRATPHVTYRTLIAQDDFATMQMGEQRKLEREANDARNAGGPAPGAQVP